MSASTWNGGAGDWADASHWTGPVPNSTTADAAITAAGTYTVTIAASEAFAARTVTLNAAGATLEVDGTLNFTQLNLANGSLAVNGTLSGGTIKASEGQYITGYTALGAHTLDHVKWIGTLNFRTGSRLSITNGLQVLAADGVSPGTIATAQTYHDATLSFVGTQTFDKVFLSRGEFTLTITGASDVLTLGPDFSTSSSGIIFNVPDPYHTDTVPTGSIVNLGTIVASRVFLQTGVGLTNRGSITTPSLYFVHGSHFFNDTSGTLSLSLDSWLNSSARFEDAFTNAGRLDAASPIAVEPGSLNWHYMLVAGLLTNATSGTFDIGNYRVLANAGLTNRGTIAVGRGGALVVGGTFANYGAVNVTDGASITLGANYLAYGGSSLAITNSTFVFSDYYSAAFTNRYRGMGDTVGFATGVDNSGRTLTFSAATIKGELDRNGTITGGTIVNADGASFVAAGGTLDGVTVRGPLLFRATALSSDPTIIRNSLIVTGPNGTGAGAVTIDRSGVYFDGTQTFDNASVSSSSGLIFARTGTLTLGPALRVAVAPDGFNAHLLVNYQATLINAGEIDGPFLINGTGSFTNAGKLVAAGGLSTIAPTTFTNLAGTTLTGGVYEAMAGAMFAISSASKIVTDSADITLSGAGSMFGTQITGASPVVSIEQTLRTITDTGALHLLDGRDYAGLKPILDDGVITLDGGAFSAGAAIAGTPGAGVLTVGANGAFSGHGELNVRKLVNNGAVDADGGTLDIVGVVSGSGTFHVGDHARLGFGSSVAAGSLVDLLGTDAALSLSAPLKFHGAIADFDAGDSITLTGTNANAFVYVPSSDRLFVRHDTTTVAVLQLQGDYTAGGFHLTQSGNNAVLTYGTPPV